MLAVEPDLLLGLAQRRFLRCVVAGVHMSAGKTDLAGVMKQVVRALGEHRRQAVRVGHQRH